MTIKQKLYLAALITPVFWLVFLWIFFVSSSVGLTSIPMVLGQTLAMSYVCAYCTTMFVAAVRRLADKT